ncbi:type IV toxin-antitoxin system AbiEi family antitoxin domain-containing protein [Ornithinimicrobium flavum]|uniref:type IV toxin-antitoxin system AbiEi family antitoxin domain-containing protein n=1 Tax=Ornithinimicrobium flavum TaxID=1288636 RepID=UPI00106FAD8A|nr:type IV toxin-antitoxin system AbiEi family antitoxin domain-containing protein [Ornithinimicrobium flavum]
MGTQGGQGSTALAHVMSVLVGQEGVADAAQLIAAGASRAELCRMVRRGELVRVRRDTLVLASALQDRTPWERRAVITRAVGLSLAPASGRPAGPAGQEGTAGPEDVVHALSHQSALVIHGLPHLGGEDELVHLCRTDGGRGRRDRTVFVHTPVVEEWVTVVDGLRVVAPAMAALQVAAHSGVEAGLVCLDGVLNRAEEQDLRQVGRRDGPARADVQEQIDRAVAQGFPRADRVVRQVVQLADGGSQSAGESRTRWLLHGLGFGPFITQFQVRERGVLLGVADLKLKDVMVLAEFDGQLKYSDPAALFAEKRREDRIREMGYEVVRLTWADLAHPARVRQMILAAIARAEARSRLGA